MLSESFDFTVWKLTFNPRIVLPLRWRDHVDLSAKAIHRVISRLTGVGGTMNAGQSSLRDPDWDCPLNDGDSERRPMRLNSGHNRTLRWLICLPQRRRSRAQTMPLAAQPRRPYTMPDLSW
jgi:hypothetical protein